MIFFFTLDKSEDGQISRLWDGDEAEGVVWTRCSTRREKQSLIDERDCV